MASESGTLYTGMTNNLERRVYEHKNGLFSGYTKQYKCTKLVYFENYDYVQDAIKREKKLKDGFAKKKKI